PFSLDPYRREGALAHRLVVAARRVRRDFALSTLDRVEPFLLAVPREPIRSVPPGLSPPFPARHRASLHIAPSAPIVLAPDRFCPRFLRVQFVQLRGKLLSQLALHS